MSYAVIVSGGKQHKVVEGEVLSLEKIELGVGETIKFDQVLMIRQDGKFKMGKPLVEGVTVEAEILSQYRGEKIRIIKFKRRKHHMKRQGHRQYLTKVRITKIA
ncbi:MAG: 50S ribosomal protein L21 [Gammaproteobacteria bacterium]|nr:50S ribosomal protein L21 [Gammaproteobacteria bacterium]